RQDVGNRALHLGRTTGAVAERGPRRVRGRRQRGHVFHEDILGRFRRQGIGLPLVEQLLEAAAEVFAADAEHRVRSKAWRDVDHGHVRLAARPIEPGVALGLAERAEALHGGTVIPAPDGICEHRAMATVAFDVDAVRRRFSALQTDLVFFDGPGGTQVPDEVIEAVSAYYRESNANVSGPYETSRRTEALVTKARLTAADFLGCSAEDTIFGANMTTLNFALSRTAGRTLSPGDEIVVT